MKRVRVPGFYREDSAAERNQTGVCRRWLLSRAFEPMVRVLQVRLLQRRSIIGYSGRSVLRETDKREVVPRESSAFLS